MAKAKKGAVRTKRREKKNVPEGIIFIYSTFNNTLITISDKLGNVVSWSSAGVIGF
jgi:small subunit ribosomal protein S11